MNVGSHGIIQDITTRDSQILNHLHPQATTISPKPVKRSQNQTKLGCLWISSPYLEEFSYLHSPVEGFLYIKPYPPPTLGNLPDTTS